MNVALTVLDAFLNTLWQAAAIAFIVWALLRSIRGMNAATRYFVWCATLLGVLLLPFAVRGVLLHPSPMTARSSDSAGQIQELTSPSAETLLVRAEPAPGAVWPWVLVTVWAALLTWRLIQIVRSYVYLRGIKRRSRLASICAPLLRRPVEVLVSSETRSPMAVGFIPPAIVLPESMLADLTDTEREHVVLHEAAHLAGYDDWMNLALRILGGVFALHPVAVWILSQVEREREMACDDWVIARTGSAEAYAESLVHLMELRHLEKYPQAAVCIFGSKSRIGYRVETLLDAGRNYSGRASRFGTLASVTGVGVLLLAGSLFPRWIAVAQDMGPIPEWQTAAGGKMSFEVASIKQRAPGAPFTPPNFPLTAENSYVATGGRFSADFPLSVYIEFAYKMNLTNAQRHSLVTHLPKWVENDKFVIQAKAAQSNPTKDQMRLMVQSLLADRFHLAVHFETRVVPVLALTLIKAGKTGPKLIPHENGPPCDSPPGPDVFPARCEATARLRSSNGDFRGGSRNQTLEMIAASLTSLGDLDSHVVDHTGLSGNFDFLLQWTPEPNDPPLPRPGTQPDPQGPTFLQAVRDQLGLKLESAKAPIRVLVVDHIERPSEN